MRKILIRLTVGVVITILTIPNTAHIDHNKVYGTPTYKPKAQTPQQRLEPFRKGWNDYKSAVRHIETQGFSDSCSYFAKSPSGLHWGRYQLGYIARKVAGHKEITYESFSTNPELQEEAFRVWIINLRAEMKPYVKKYSGKFIDGIRLSESGIIAMAHNVGGPETRRYLDRGYEPPGPLKFLNLNEFNLDLN